MNNIERIKSKIFSLRFRQVGNMCRLILLNVHFFFVVVVLSESVTEREIPQNNNIVAVQC